MQTLKIKPGDQFGLLIAVREALPDAYKHRRWVFRCACGAETIRVVAAVMRTVAHGRRVAGCPRCQRFQHSKYLRESFHGSRMLARKYGSERAAAVLLDPVDIDRDLPEVYG